MLVTVSCVRVWGFPNCTLVTKFRAKAQRRKENAKPSLRLSLRLCAFARDPFLRFALSFFSGLLANRTGQHASRVTLSISASAEIHVEAELSSPARTWSFRNVYAGVLGMAERIGDFRATATNGQDAQVKKSAAGEFRSELDATRITYTVKLSEPRATDVPHVSWLADDRGFLMFADLIPQDIETLSAEFKLPTDWTVESSLVSDSNTRYTVSEPLKAVFLVGRSLRKTSNTIDGVDLNVVLSGVWPFKEAEALKVASTVLKKYLALTGFELPDRTAIMIAPSPIANSFGLES